MLRETEMADLSSHAIKMQGLLQYYKHSIYLHSFFL